MSLIYSNIPELEDTDTEITLSNLSRLEVELHRLFEKRIAHLCELSRAILRDGGDADLVKSIILSIRSDGEIDSEDLCSENLNEITKLFSSISFIERLFIFKEVFGELPLDPGELFGSGILSAEASNRIAYIRNSYNDNAFEKFAEWLDGAKASYFDNVTDVCESVRSGRCQYCILPLETMRDGRLISFYGEMIGYGLRINAEYDLRGADGAGYTRYALLGKTLKRPKNNVDYVEITYCDENLSLREILNAAEYCGLEIESVDTFSVDDVGERKRFCAVFSSHGADTDAFLTYLTVDCPDVTIVGLYKRI